MTGAHERPGLKLGRRDLLILCAVVLGAAVLGWTVHQVGVVRAQNDALAAALATEQRQVQDAGLTPAAPAPSEILRDPELVEGPPGDRGEQGPQGPPGPSGNMGPVGPMGAVGPAGVDGQDGVDGADGAQGPIGPEGQQGPRGEPGEDGKDGKAPAGWKVVDPLGMTYECTRDPESPDDAPTYTCRAAA